MQTKLENMGEVLERTEEKVNRTERNGKHCVLVYFYFYIKKL